MKKLFLGVLSLFLVLGVTFAQNWTGIDESVKSWALIAEALVQKIKNKEMTFDQAKTIIEWGISYYLGKANGMSEKDIPNLMIFDHINTSLILYSQFDRENPNLIEYNWRKYTLWSYTKRDVFSFVDTENNGLASYLWKHDLTDEVLIPGEKNDIYVVRVSTTLANTGTNQKIGRLLLTYWDKLIKPYWVTYYDETTKGSELKFYRDEKYSSPTSSNWDVKAWGLLYYVYIVPKDATNLKFTFENDPKKTTVELAKLAEFKYYYDSIIAEIEKIAGWLPFCIRTFGKSLRWAQKVLLKDCQEAYKGNFRTGMREELFYQWNEENNYPYSSNIRSSTVGDQYCAETKYGKECLWIGDWKIDSITSYDYK